MSSTRFASGRVSGRPSRARLALLASVAMFGALTPAAQAADPPVKIQSVFASPISKDEGQCNPTDAAGILARAAADTTNTPNQAGGSADLCFGFTLPDADAFNTPDDDNKVLITGDDMKRLSVTMPAGMSGSVGDIPKCSTEQFGDGNFLVPTCPDDAMVGTIFTTLKARISYADGSAGLNSNINNKGGWASPQWDAGNGRWNGLRDGGYLYNLEPGPNDLAKMGAVIQPVSGLAPAKFTISLRIASDGRVQTVVDSAPRAAYTFDPDNPTSAGNSVNADGTLKGNAVPSDLYVQAIGIRVWGNPAGRTLAAHTVGGVTYPEAPLMGGKSFIQWGTDCTNAGKAQVDLTTYNGVQSSGESNGIQLTGCDALPFLPDVKFQTTATSPATPTGLTVNVSLGQTESGNPRSALLKDASVTMPEGLEIGAQVASGPNGLPLCTAAAFAKDSTTDNTCPAGSKVGDVSITTPLLPKKFVGAVYLGQQAAVGELPPLYLQAALEGSSGDDAPRIKLIGAVKVDDNGRLTTTFSDAPQLRFSDLSIAFPGGDHALFITPRTCNPAVGKSTFTSSASATPVSVDGSIQMTTDCALPGFAPQFSMSTTNNAVAAKAPTTVTIARPDRSPWLKDVKVSLPRASCPTSPS